MKERPIIFSAPMVRALLDGLKTQTRRICKTMNAWVDQSCREVRHVDEVPHHFLKGAITPIERLRCPYGQPGDRLWVRETWQAFFADEVPASRPRGPRHTMGIPAQPERESFVFYRADGDLSHPEDGSEAIWRSPIHMPRWASRITLEIVSVRVERLQEISAKDVLAEGAVLRAHDDQFGHNPVSAFDGCVYLDLKSLWARGWDSINANRAPWESNPWAWVIEFRVIEREARG